jgi:serine/threonine protein kinase
MGIEQPRSPEQLNHEVEELLFSGERVGEGGKAFVLKLSPDNIPPELRPAFESLSFQEGEVNIDSSADKAIKLFKLYLPHKTAFEYEMHAKAYAALQKIPKEESSQYAKIPKLSSSRELIIEEDIRKKLEERFSIMVADKVNLIAMEYIPGEDLATIFYKWILEKNGFTPEQTDELNFKQLYEELVSVLGLDSLPDEEMDDAHLPMAEWKVSANNTKKIYEYLRKYKFPMPTDATSRVEKTIQLMHKEKMTHGDAFERNIMITGGSKALRAKGNLDDEEIFLIDFGETRDKFLEEVDDFNVVRRLKTLSLSLEDERKIKDKERLGEITAKGELLRVNKKWVETYTDTQKILETNPEKALSFAWNTIVPFGENAMENFFIMIKDLINNGSLERTSAEAFIEEKSKEKMTPYARNLLNKCVKWLAIS